MGPEVLQNRDSKRSVSMKVPLSLSLKLLEGPPSLEVIEQYFSNQIFPLLISVNEFY